MKRVTSAIVIINRDGNILGCHATGKPKGTGYDFPKGMVEVGESDRDAAIRELWEETDITLKHPERLIDCGVHPHNREKDIHIFLYQTDYFPGPWKCNSFFELNGHKIPEVDSYMVISKKQRGMFNKVLQDKFEIIDSFNSDENRNRN